MTEVAARPDAPADIAVIAPAGTDPSLYADAGATWVLITGWLDELCGPAAAPPPGSSYFLLNCSDVGCRAWWPGVHLALRNVARHDGHLGDVVVMDEFRSLPRWTTTRLGRDIGLWQSRAPREIVVW